MSDEDEEFNDEGFMNNIGKKKASTFFDDNDGGDDEPQLGGSPGSEGVVQYKGKPRHCRMGDDALTIGNKADPNDNGIKSIVPLTGCTVDVVDEYFNIELPNEKVYELKAEDETAAQAWADAITARATAPSKSPRKREKDMLRRVKSLDLMRGGLNMISEDDVLRTNPVRRTKSVDLDESGGSPRRKSREHRSSLAEVDIEIEQAVHLEVEERVVQLMEVNNDLEEQLETLNLQIEVAEAEMDEDELETELAAYREKEEEIYIEKNLELEAERDAITVRLAKVQGRVTDLEETFGLQESEINDNKENMEVLKDEAEMLRSEGDSGGDEDLEREIAAAKKRAAETARRDAEEDAELELEANKEMVKEQYEEYFLTQVEEKETELAEWIQQKGEADQRTKDIKAKMAGSQTRKRTPEEQEAFIEEKVLEAVAEAEVEAEEKILAAQEESEAKISQAEEKADTDGTKDSEAAAFAEELAEITSALTAMESDADEAEERLATLSKEAEEVSFTQQSLTSQIGSTRTKLRNAQLQAESAVVKTINQAVPDAREEAETCMEAEKRQHVRKAEMEADREISAELNSSRGEEHSGAILEAQSELQSVRDACGEAKKETEQYSSDGAAAQKKLQELASALSETQSLQKIEEDSTSHEEVQKDNDLQLIRARERESRLEAETRLASATDAYTSQAARQADATAELEKLDRSSNDQRRSIEDEVERESRKAHSDAKAALQSQVDATVMNLRRAVQEAAEADVSCPCHLTCP